MDHREGNDEKIAEAIFVFQSLSVCPIPVTLIIHYLENKKIWQASDRINKGWAKLWVLKCGRERWFFGAHLPSKNTSLPTQRPRAYRGIHANTFHTKVLFWTAKCNGHPQAFNYRFYTNEVNKASNAAQNKALDAEVVVR